MLILVIKAHLLVPRSRSSAKVKVKYQGHNSKKKAVSGASVYHKHILLLFTVFKIPIIGYAAGGALISRRATCN